MLDGVIDRVLIFVVGIEDADIEYFSELDIVGDLDNEFDLVNDLVARLVVATAEGDRV